MISPELSSKRLELLKQIVPGLSRVGVVWDPTNVTHPKLWQETRVAAATLGLETRGLEMTGTQSFERVFEGAANERVDGLVVPPEPICQATPNRGHFVDFSKQRRLPTIYAFRELALVGGLLVYGPNTPDPTRRGASYVDKILKGAKPVDLPIEQPATFDFVINVQAAQQIGLTVPQSILAQATELVQ